MLRYQLIHPTLLATLASAGHGSRVLLADANYPLRTALAPAAQRVELNLRPGQVPVTDILACVLDAAPVEDAHVMMPDDSSEPPIFAEFRELLDLPLRPLARQEFYAAARAPDVALGVASGDQRLFANILLTLGVVAPD